MRTEYCQPHLIPSVWCPKEVSSAGSAFSWCAGGCPDHCCSRLLSEQGVLVCLGGQYWGQGAWRWHSRASGGCTHTDCRLFIAITFGPSANCWELAGVMRGEAGSFGLSGFLNRGIKREKEGWSRGHGACWLLGTEWFPAASVQHKGEWASSQGGSFYEPC